MSPKARAAAAHFRAHERRRVALSATLRDGRGAFSWRVRVRDLGLGGAGIELDQPIDGGHEVVLEIVAPSLWDPLVVRGDVAWAQGERAGVRFAFEDPSLLFALFEVLAAEGFE